MGIGATASCPLGQPGTARRASRESARWRPSGPGVSHARVQAAVIPLDGRCPRPGRTGPTAPVVEATIISDCANRL